MAVVNKVHKQAKIIIIMYGDGYVLQYRVLKL